LVVTELSVLAVAVALLGIVVGLRAADRVRHRRSYQRLLGKRAAFTMTPARWAAVGLTLLVVAILSSGGPGPRRNASRPDAVAVTPPGEAKPAPPADAPDSKNSQAAQSQPAPSNSTPEATDHASPTVPSDLAEAAAEEQRWCNQGDRMMAIGQYSMAAQAYWEALRIDPSSQRARAGLTRARRAEAEAEAARQQESLFPMETPSATEIPTERPVREASSALKRPARETPPTDDSRWGPQEDARFHVQRGDRFLERGMVQAAIAEYQKALESNPSDAQARARLERARGLVTRER